MAMSKKAREFFEKYVAYIEKLGDKFDFYKTAKVVDNSLKKYGIPGNSPKFFANVLDELENEKSSWKPDYDGLLKPFFDALPDKWKKEKITKEIVYNRIPKAEWGSYKMLASIRASEVLAEAFNKVVTADVDIKIDKRSFNKDKIKVGYTVEIKAGDISYLLEGVDLEGVHPEDLEEAMDDFFDGKKFRDHMEESLWETLSKDFQNVEDVNIKLTGFDKVPTNLASLKDAKFEFDIEVTVFSTDLEQKTEDALDKFFSDDPYQDRKIELD